MTHPRNIYSSTCQSCACQYEIGDTKGYEYKSKTQLFGIPLIHVSFKYEKQSYGWKPIMAKGILAIGQFSAGVISIGQFSVGVLSISQFAISIAAIAQFAMAHVALAQIALAQYGLASLGYISNGFTYFP